MVNNRCVCVCMCMYIYIYKDGKVSNDTGIPLYSYIHIRYIYIHNQQ